MAKFEIDVVDCAHCPCLRNNELGNFYCFYNLFHIIDVDKLTRIDRKCPLNKNKTNK